MIQIADHLLNLLHLLDRRPPNGLIHVDGWRVQPIPGGSNNLLYRATSELYAGDGEGDFAIKLTIDDERDRAGREYEALLALEYSRADLAPRPILLDRTRFNRPVVVQTWVPGATLTTPPANDAEWLALVEYHLAVHRVTPVTVSLPLRSTILTAYTPADCQHIIRKQLERVPEAARPAGLTDLIRRFAATPMTGWSFTAPVLVRNDANFRNFIREKTAHGTYLRSVDWEYAGWGNPAFEVADLVMHAAYLDMGDARRQWFIDQYCTRAGRPDLLPEIHAYCQTVAVWWAIRMARYLYDIPHGLDVRLVEPDADWQEKGEARYERYLAMAHTLLDGAFAI